MTLTLPQAPELSIKLRGEIIASNFDDFHAVLSGWIASSKVALVTDEEFSRAEEDTKTLKAAEKALAAAKESALEQAKEVRALFSRIDHLATDARNARLDLERQIKKRKEEIITGIVDEAAVMVDVNNHVPVRRKIVEAMRGKKTIDTLRAAAMACAKQMAEELEENRQMIIWFEDSNGRSMTTDSATLEMLPAGELKIELQRRLDRHEADEREKKLKAEAAALKAKEAKDKPELTQLDKRAEPESKPLAEQQAYRPVTAETEAEEFARFLEAVKSAFQPLRAARAGLKHEQNIERAAAFADALAVAWRGLNS